MGSRDLLKNFESIMLSIIRLPIQPEIRPFSACKLYILHTFAAENTNLTRSGSLVTGQHYLPSAKWSPRANLTLLKKGLPVGLGISGSNRFLRSYRFLETNESTSYCMTSFSCKPTFGSSEILDSDDLHTSALFTHSHLYI